ncbi:hypothetical protein T439DRAFT_376766 [Meredithblackwellia eburnea MCA 4105]
MMSAQVMGSQPYFSGGGMPSCMLPLPPTPTSPNHPPQSCEGRSAETGRLPSLADALRPRRLSLTLPPIASTSTVPYPSPPHSFFYLSQDSSPIPDERRSPTPPTAMSAFFTPSTAAGVPSRLLHPAPPASGFTSTLPPPLPRKPRTKKVVAGDDLAGGGGGGGGQQQGSKSSSTSRFSLSRAIVPSPAPKRTKTTSWSGVGKVKGKELICADCDKVFTKPSALEVHRRSHTHERPFVCPEEGCTQAFAAISNLRRHQKRIHGDSDPIPYSRPSTETKSQHSAEP